MIGIWWYFLYYGGIALACYLLGCFNGAVIVSKYILRDDVRNHGSGNAGLTNFHRTFGGGLTLVVILCDVLKAVLAVLLGSWLFGGNPMLGKYFAALFCLLGHMFPCMFHFKGGKGILSGGTIALMIDWRVALVVWGGFLVLVIVTRYVSLGSLWAGACFPEVRVVVLAFLLGGLVVWQHRGNAQRLIHGKERKLSFHKEKEGGS